MFVKHNFQYLILDNTWLTTKKWEAYRTEIYSRGNKEKSVSQELQKYVQKFYLCAHSKQKKAGDYGEKELQENIMKKPVFFKFDGLLIRDISGKNQQEFRKSMAIKRQFFSDNCCGRTPGKHHKRWKTLQNSIHVEAFLSALPPVYFRSSACIS